MNWEWKKVTLEEYLKEIGCIEREWQQTIDKMLGRYLLEDHSEREHYVANKILDWLCNYRCEIRVEE